MASLPVGSMVPPSIGLVLPRMGVVVTPVVGVNVYPRAQGSVLIVGAAPHLAVGGTSGQARGAHAGQKDGFVSSFHDALPRLEAQPQDRPPSLDLNPFGVLGSGVRRVVLSLPTELQ